MSLIDTVLRLKPVLEKVSFIDALWIEGSYATGTFTSDSDIDVWMSVSEGRHEEASDVFRKALEEEGVLRGEITFKVYSEDPRLSKTTFYLNGNSDEQCIELDIQSSKRDFLFTRGGNDVVIVFDKTGVIKWQ
jgi:predicted nucleotidyltransferase